MALKSAILGARFSAYWRQRVGALILRLPPHESWLYVDDLVAVL